MSHFIPDFMFQKYTDVTVDFLKSNHISMLLIDIDNTLAPYEQPEPDQNILQWFQSLKDENIQCAFISNNHKERVERFNASLGLYASYDSHKPLKKELIKAMNHFHVSKEDTAMLGDQIFTDCYAGKHIGLRSIMLPPIKDKTNFFFRFKRWLERPFIRKFAKKNGYQEWMSFWKVRK